MPLITCTDCESQISDAAPACPKCGRPNVRTTGPVQIEQTAKTWKIGQVLAATLTLGGCMTCATSGQSEEPMKAGIALFFLGIAGFVAARIGAWWNNG